MKKLPSQEEWENHEENLDANYAYRNFFGKTKHEMQKEFRLNVIERVEDIRWMPLVPFQYYIFGLRDYVIKKEWGFCDGSDAASCYLGLIKEKLEQSPLFINPILDELLPSLNYVANNQLEYEADESIYGNFQDQYREIIRISGA